MDSWGKFGENTVSPKEAFYSVFNEEGISDADYVHVQKVWEEFKIKNRGGYHDLYLSVIHCCSQMCLKNSEIGVSKYMNLILLFF